MAFTGGEPMMNQNAIVDIMLEFERRNNFPKYVTIETNGTQGLHGTSLSDMMSGEINGKFRQFMADYYGNDNIQENEWFWSVSPKLYLSGEEKEDALRPEVVLEYNHWSSRGQLKYVCDGSDRSWKEVEEFTKVYRDFGIKWPVWIMPVGADIEGQNKVAAKITEGAVERGYNVAARVHTYIFGNKVGK
jgi:organic radical activating enzyme